MNHHNLALVAPEPVTSQLHQIGLQIRLGDIFTCNSDQELATARLGSNNVFSEARGIAHDNKGTPVVFAGKFPDGKDRVQATLSVPSGQSVSEHREKLAALFGASSSDVSCNHFTKTETGPNGQTVSTGHNYLSLTVEL
jgi:hypothetical protein